MEGSPAKSKSSAALLTPGSGSTTMEVNNRKQQPVRITYKIVKKEDQTQKQQEAPPQVTPPEGVSGVSHKQKRVLVAFLEEHGRDGMGLMCGTGEDNTDRDMVETVGGGLWREVAVMLNSARVGGCVMSPQEWRKYWLELMETTKKSTDRLKERNPRMRLESLPQLHRRIYKLACREGPGESGITSAERVSWMQVEDDDRDSAGGALIRELAGQMNCRDGKGCNNMIEHATQSQGNFDAVYLEEACDSNMELEDEGSANEDNAPTQQQTRNTRIVKNSKKRRRQWEKDTDTAIHDRETNLLQQKYQSSINYLRLKQERLKVCLLEREIELRTIETEHRKQIHEVEMKRRQMEMVHMDAMHSKVLHMSHL